MPRQPRAKSESGIHHAMLRGTDRRPIFRKPADYEHFLECIASSLMLTGARVLAYVLMPNHVHLLIEEGDVPLSSTMQRLAVRYAVWFNREYDRVGHLFQNRYRNKPVEDDTYLLTVLLYIHFNPVVAGMCAQPDEYRWSSRSQWDNPDAITDVARLLDLIPMKTLLSAEAGYRKEDSDAMRDRLEPAASVSDEEALALLTDTYDITTTAEFLHLERPLQIEAVQLLRSHRVACRQISRVTGISRSTVQRWAATDDQIAA